MQKTGFITFYGREFCYVTDKNTHNYRRSNLVGSFRLVGFGGSSNKEENPGYLGSYAMDRPAWSAGLEFSYPLGDRTARANHALALLNVRRAQVAVDLAVQEISQQINVAWRAVQMAYERYQLTQAAARLAELDGQEENLRLSLSIEDSSLQLAERELERLRSLADAVPESELDNKQRQVLAQRQSAQTLHNSLNILPAQRTALEATLDAKKATLKQAKLDLSDTVITAPLDCRIGEVRLEVLDSEGSILPGRGFEDCDPINGDLTDRIDGSRLEIVEKKTKKSPHKNRENN